MIKIFAHTIAILIKVSTFCLDKKQVQWCFLWNNHPSIILGKHSFYQYIHLEKHVSENVLSYVVGGKPTSV